MRAKVSAKKIGFKIGPAAAYIPAHTTTTEARTTSTRANEAGCRCSAVSGCFVSRSLPSADTNFYSFPKRFVRFRRVQRPKARRATLLGISEYLLLEHQYSSLLIHRHILDREQDALKAEEAHPHADVLRLAAPVQEELLDHTDRLLSRVTEPEARVLLRSGEPLACSLYRCVGQRAIPPFRASFLGSLLDRLRLLLSSLLVGNFLWSSCSSWCISWWVRPALSQSVRCLRPSVPLNPTL